MFLSWVSLSTTRYPVISLPRGNFWDYSNHGKTHTAINDSMRSFGEEGPHSIFFKVTWSIAYVAPSNNPDRATSNDCSVHPAFTTVNICTPDSMIDTAATTDMKVQWDCSHWDVLQQSWLHGSINTEAERPGWGHQKRLKVCKNRL